MGNRLLLRFRMSAPRFRASVDVVATLHERNGCRVSAGAVSDRKPSARAKSSPERTFLVDHAPGRGATDVASWERTSVTPRAAPAPHSALRLPPEVAHR